MAFYAKNVSTKRRIAMNQKRVHAHHAEILSGLYVTTPNPNGIWMDSFVANAGMIPRPVWDDAKTVEVPVLQQVI